MKGYKWSEFSWGEEWLQNTDIRNLRPKDTLMSNDANHVVRENDICQHWECIGEEVLAPMHECWYCKHSDFRKDIRRQLESSVCHCPLNQMEGEKEK